MSNPPIPNPRVAFNPSQAFLQCEICAWMLKAADSALYPATLDNFFHSKCVQCRISLKSEPELCSICTHLRLGHLATCARLEVAVSLPIGSIFEIIDRQRCPLCRMLARAVTTKIHFPDPTKPLWLRFSPSYEHNHRCLHVYAKHIFCDVGQRSDLPMFSLSFSIVNPTDCLAPLSQRVTNWAPIKQRLDQCFAEHTNCATQPATMPKGFRVVDVEQRRLVDAPSGCRYVALSYVWGPNPSSSLLLTTKATIDAFQEAGSLVAEKMPQTIEDAMYVCSRLDEKYLWADRLCIVQDDHDDKRKQIQAMSSIYSSAAFVIIDADGDHMDAGLGGVSHSREEQIHCTIDGHQVLVAVVASYYQLTVPKSTWATRGWTYQEAILARRKLSFSSSQIFFECESEVWHEDSLGFGHGDSNKISDGPTSSVTLDLGLEPNASFSGYARHLKNYRKRQLSSQSDIFNAFTGILSVLYPHDDVAYGLPLPDFEQALLWRCSDFRNSPCSLHSSEDMLLPSWSWGSVVNHTLLPNDYDFRGPLALWTVYSDQGIHHRGHRRSPSSWSHPNHWRVKWTRVYMFVAWSAGCVESPLPQDVRSWRTMTFNNLDEILTSRWPTYGDFCDEVFINSDIPCVSTPPPPGTLHGRVPVATFRLRRHPSSQFLLQVVDCHGSVIGNVFRGEPRVLSEIIPRIATTSDEEVHLELFKFIGLSISTESFRDGPSGRSLQFNHDDDINYSDVKGNTFERPPVVLVMVVANRGPYSYRITTGYIFLRHWVRTKCTFEDVLLV